MPHTTNEILRKSLHIAFGLFAFTLKSLPWYAAAGVCVVAIIGNTMLHRVVGRGVSRHSRGYDAGIVLYPVMVLLLVVVFRNRLEYAAIAWAMLAFGDGVATLAGRWMRIAPLPWNPDKSIGGLLAFLIAGIVSGLAVAYWMDYSPAPFLVIIAAIAAGITESLPLRVDDNVTVPFAAAVACVVAGIMPMFPYGPWPASIPWLIVNGVLALVGYFAKSVSFSGAIGGWCLGAILILGAGWPMYVALLAFFVIGTLTTKLGYARKARLGLAQESGGRRGFSHAFSNVGVAAICAIAVSRLSRLDFMPLELVAIAYFMGIASLATAAADTTASEIGQLIGRRAFLPLTLRRVPVGTEGAISIEGTLVGLFGGALVAAAGVLSLHYGLMPTNPGAIFFITAAAFLGSYIESIAGSWNRKLERPVPNGVLNFFNTAVGAILTYYFVQ